MTCFHFALETTCTDTISFYHLILSRNFQGGSFPVISVGCLQIHFSFVANIKHRELELCHGWFCTKYCFSSSGPPWPHFGPGNVKELGCQRWKRCQGRLLTCLAYLSRHASHPLPQTHDSFTVPLIHVLARSILRDLKGSQAQVPSFPFLNCICLS